MNLLYLAMALALPVLVGGASHAAFAAPAVVPEPLRTGSILSCQLSDTASLVFDGKVFTSKGSKEKARLQIKVLREEIEMTLTASTGEIYVEKDFILSRSSDNRSLFAVYQAPVGNIVSIALHTMKHGVTVFTQSKSYQLGDTIYQGLSSGRCHRL